jgi:SAM-dependent methyltransferase
MPTLVEIPKYNTILGDDARKHYEPSTATLFALCPEIMTRKLPQANIQQGFMLAAVLSLCHDFPRTRILSVGCFEDTAYESLKRMGIRVDGIDPATNDMDLDRFFDLNPDLHGTYDIVFSTSVIEHVEQDEEFVRKIAAFMRPGGYAIFTCDFRDGWRQGDRVPSLDFRFYTAADLRCRIPAAMPGCKLIDEPNWESFEPEFKFGGCVYNFASTVLQKAGA